MELYRATYRKYMVKTFVATKMAYVLKQLYNIYHYYMVEYSDPRSDNLPIVNYTLATFGIVALYLYFVLSLGPRLMEKSEPFRLKKVLIWYNSFQILSNILVWMYVIKWTYYKGNYGLACNAASSVDDTSIIGTSQVFATYLFFLLKILDLLDTIFFVMRKRFTHITFLHVYHHSAMVIATYIAVRFLPAGHGTMLGVLNCLVHAIMYGYYLVSAINENVKKSIWWKKHITQVQMIQFLILAVHFGQTLFNADCLYPKPISFIMAIQNIFMLFMFGDFYRNAYLRKKCV